MSFSDNLVQARGQIAWIVALLLSFGAIFYLESRGISGRQFETGSRPSVGGMNTDPKIQQAVRDALAVAKTAFDSNPTDPSAQSALIVAAIAAGQVELLSQEDIKGLVYVASGAITAPTAATDAALALARVVHALP